MNDLIERLQKASGPDQELDYDIQCEVDGSGRPPAYTASLDAALALVPDGFASAVGTMAFRNSDEKPWACYWTPQGEPHSTEAATPAIALCIAALKARGAR